MGVGVLNLAFTCLEFNNIIISIMLVMLLCGVLIFLAYVILISMLWWGIDV